MMNGLDFADTRRVQCNGYSAQSDLAWNVYHLTIF